MGLFDIFKKKQKEDPEEIYKDKSIDELAGLIREQRFPDPSLCSVYVKKLLRAPAEEGGLGFSDEEIGFADSPGSNPASEAVQSDGIYWVKLGDGSRRVCNFRLDYIISCIRAGITNMAKCDKVEAYNISCNISFAASYIFVLNDSLFSNRQLKDKNSPVYNRWVYLGDKSFVEYKLKVIGNILLNKANLEKFGAYKVKDGKIADEFITIEDLTCANTRSELAALLDSYQTNDLEEDEEEDEA